MFGLDSQRFSALGGVAGAIGMVMGVLAGYLGGWVDALIMRLGDIQLAFPFILLAIMFLVVLGSGVWNLILVLGIGQWVTYARIVRADTLSLREKEFVEAARASGANDRRIVFRHILPNAMSPIIVQTTLIVGAAIIIEAALSFLGFGIVPPTPTWGSMVSDGGRMAVRGEWWLLTFSGIALVSTVLAINFLGDGLRDALDPKQTIDRR